MAKIDVRNGKLVNTLTGKIISDKMVVNLIALQKVRFFENAEHVVIDLKDRDTGESYFILPSDYTYFSLRYAAYILGSHGRTAKDTPLILTVNSTGELQFNFDLRLRICHKQKLSA
jgi:hypothetical protein